MGRTISIEVKNISKVYKLYERPQDRFKEALHPLKKQYHREFFALDDISFDVHKGETIGIIGKNGSGKSTLLKILTGLVTPTTGTVQVNGKVSALLELGAGFNPEYTGIQNIFLNGMVMGFTHNEMKAKLDDILSFADIGEFVYQPVKMYSSGMFVRLAFAVAINVEPEILIVDEALAVGDIFFQSKCMNKMSNIINNGTSVILVSHDMLSIKRIAQKAIWLENGNIVEMGEPIPICNKYSLSMNTNKIKNTNQINEVPDIPSSIMEYGEYRLRMGTGEALIEEVFINGQKMKPVDTVRIIMFDEVIIKVKFKIVNKDIDDINLSIVFFDSEGVYCSGMCTMYDNLKVDIKDGIAVLKIKSMILLNGLYSISVGLSDRFVQVHYDLHERMYDIQVISTNVRDEGIVYLPHEWEV